MRAPAAGRYNFWMGIWGDVVDIRDKFAGVVLGTAIGDALGYPVEFMSVEEIKRRFGPAGVTTLHPVRVGPHGARMESLYSDDTQMFRAVCEGLIRAGPTASLDTAAEEVAEEIVAWAFGSENNRSPGGSCMHGANNLRQNYAWRMAGQHNGGGCGAAMRSMAYGLWHWDDPVEAAYWAGEHALMTHRSPMAQASAAAVAAGIAMGVMGGPPDAVVAAMVEGANGYDAATARMLLQAREDAGHPSTPPAEVLDRWRGWKGDEAVAASLYCALEGGSYRNAVLLAVNSPGDSDSLGAITGALMGAMRGATGQIPAEWIPQVEKSQELITLAVRLWKAWHQTHGIVQVPLRKGRERPISEHHQAEVIEFKAKARG